VTVLVVRWGNATGLPSPIFQSSHKITGASFNRVNMVRSGVVNHPEEWPFCGYNEIQNPRQRYSLIDYQRLISLLQMKDLSELQESCRKSVEQSLASRDKSREIKWSESIAVGSKSFIDYENKINAALVYELAAKIPLIKNPK